MSEYQYYEFTAVDKPLNEKDMQALEDLSSRARITPTSFVNEYNWGNFKGDPLKLVEKYFDAFLYVANWGTHWFMLKVPRNLVDVGLVKKYCPAESARIHEKGDHIIWKKVGELIDSKQPAKYDEAIKLLVDLRDLNKKTAPGKVFKQKLKAICANHYRKVGFLNRLQKADLSG
jgi:hypothetical protein